MAKMEELLVQIIANTEGLRTELARSESDVNRFQSGVERSLNNIDKGFSGVGSALSGFRTALGALGISVSIGGMVQLGLQAMDTASNIKQSAKQLGLSAEEYQGFQQVARDAGVEQGEFNTAIGNFVKLIGQAKGGSEAAKQQLHGLTIESEDLQKKTNAELILQFANAIAGIQDPASKSAVLVKDLGRSGGALAAFFSQGAAGIDKASKDYQNSLSVMSTDTTDKLDAIEREWNNLKATIVAVSGTTLAGSGIAEFFTAIEKEIERRKANKIKVDLGDIIEVSWDELWKQAEADFQGSPERIRQWLFDQFEQKVFGPWQKKSIEGIQTLEKNIQDQAEKVRKALPDLEVPSWIKNNLPSPKDVADWFGEMFADLKNLRKSLPDIEIGAWIKEHMPSAKDVRDWFVDAFNGLSSLSTYLPDLGLGDWIRNQLPSRAQVTKWISDLFGDAREVIDESVAPPSASAHGSPRKPTPQVPEIGAAPRPLPYSSGGGSRGRSRGRVIRRAGAEEEIPGTQQEYTLEGKPIDMAEALGIKPPKGGAEQLSDFDRVLKATRQSVDELNAAIAGGDAARTMAEAFHAAGLEVGDTSDKAKELHKAVTDLTNAQERLALGEEAERQAMIATKEGVAEWEARMEEGKRLTEDFMTPMERYTARMEYLNGLYKDGAIKIDIYNRAGEEAKKTLDASSQSANKLGQAAGNAGDRLVGMFFDAATSAADFNNILSNTLNIFANMAAQMAGGGLQDWLGGWITGLFKPAAAPRLIGPGPVVSPSLTHAAGGGRVAPYWVGERGPELFVPDMPGTILPAGTGIGGGPTININNAITLNTNGGGTPAQNRDLADRASAAFGRAMRSEIESTLVYHLRPRGMLNPNIVG